MTHALLIQIQLRRLCTFASVKLGNSKSIFSILWVTCLSIQVNPVGKNQELFFGEEFKYHLVDWDTVCVPIRKGGLGVRRLKLFNQAFLGKWLWRFVCVRERWWRKVVVAKYGCRWGEWSLLNVSLPHGVGLWRGIMNGWEAFVRNTHLEIGARERVKF